MTSKKLDLFENHVPQDLLLQGEKLYGTNPPKLLSLIDKNLYVFQTNHQDNLIESEILLSGLTIKSVTCECEGFDKDSNCEHVVSASFALRKLKAEKPKKTKAKKIKSSFNLDDVLKTISHEELVNFIKSYGKKDQKFNLSLKTNFARRITNVDPELKYEALLDSIIKPIRNIASKYSASSIAQFLALAKELHAQMKDAISLNQYTEAFYILKNLLQKSAYAITNAKAQPDNLEIFYLMLHQEIELLYAADLAPELKADLSKFLLKTLSYSYYIYPSFHENIPQKLLKFASFSERQELVNTLQTRFKFNLEKEEIEMSLALELLAIGSIEGDWSQLFKRLKPEYLKNMFNYLLKIKEYDLLRDFIADCSEVEHLAKFPFHDVIILIAEKKSDFPLLAEAYAKRYQTTRNLSFLKNLLTLDIKYSKPFLKQTIKVINARKKDQQYLIDIAYVMKDYDELVKLIEAQDDFGRLELYFDDLLAEDPSYLDSMLHYFLNKAKNDIAYYHRNIRTLKDLFLSKKHPQSKLWKTLFDIAEEQHDKQIIDQNS